VASFEGFVSAGATLSAGVYLLVHKGDVVYVGKSNHLLRRWYEHRSAYYLSRQKRMQRPQKKAMLFDDIHYQSCGLKELDALERELIAKYRPRYNEKHNATRGSVVIPVDFVLQGVVLNRRPVAQAFQRRV
jgi:excinuclease UvrABC nuclease subunit